MSTLFLLNLAEDGIFAAIAAVGFASISNPPRRVLPACALIAAAGHATRYALMKGPLHMHIILAAFLAAIVIGLLSLLASRRMRCPSETFSYPALLPMIPGMYAYGAVQALLKCFTRTDETHFQHYFNLLNYNALLCSLIVLMMVVGIMLPRLLIRR